MKKKKQFLCLIIIMVIFFKWFNLYEYNYKMIFSFIFYYFLNDLFCLNKTIKWDF